MAEDKSGAVTLKQGLPPEQSNGLFGGEERIMALGVKGRITAVVEIEVADIIHSEAKESTRPVVELVRIEPLWKKGQIEAARAIHETAYKERTGANQLNFDGIQDGVASAALLADQLADGEKGAKDATVTEIAPGNKGQF